MSIPRGMSLEQIPLSEGQQKDHHIIGGAVTAVVLKQRGDGWVENTGANGHLSGDIVQKRKRGSSYTHEFLPVDNVLLQASQVHDQISGELELLAGSYNQDGEWEEGELELLKSSQAMLFNWLTLTPDDKDEIKKSFAGMADIRVGAHNPFNLTAGSIANRARELKDRTGRNNPGAILAMVLKLERQFNGRHGELAHNLSLNHLRRGRLQHEWLFQENQILSGTHVILERLLTSQDDDDLDALRLMARHIRFRVGPLNQMAYTLAQTGGRIEEDQVVIDALAAMQFDRFKNYLLSPFRRLTSTPKKLSARTVNSEEEPMYQALERRMASLYSMDAHGATGRLINRLIPLGETVLQATYLDDEQRAKKAAKAFKWLVNYHCEAGGDPEQEVWYSRQLR